MIPKRDIPSLIILWNQIIDGRLKEGDKVAMALMSDKYLEFELKEGDKIAIRIEDRKDEPGLNVITEEAHAVTKESLDLLVGSNIY